MLGNMRHKMLGNLLPCSMPIIESREEVYCRNCEIYTEMLRHVLNGQPAEVVLDFAWNATKGYKERPKHLDCGDCVSPGMYGNRRLIASMEKLCAGIEKNTERLIKQSVGEFLTDLPVDA